MQFSDKEENYRLILIFGPPLRTINRGKDLAEWKNGATFVPGKLAEWSIAAVLKTVEGNTSGGSNPSLSASNVQLVGIQQAAHFFALIPLDDRRRSVPVKKEVGCASCRLMVRTRCSDCVPMRYIDPDTIFALTT